MAYRPVKWNEETVQRFQREGRGRGEGAAYKPWLTVADVSSLGLSRRVWSGKTGRQHELLSDVEYKLFICLEWSRDVIDIREQYPLERDITQQIAQELGLPHPHYRGTNVPVVMTVDVLATHVREGEPFLKAYNAKREEEAEDEKSMARLEIQRVYFEYMGVPHHLVFHSMIPANIAANISWIRDAAMKPSELEPRPGYFDELMRRMESELVSAGRGMKLSGYCADFDNRYGLESGTGLRAARMLMQERVLVADLDQKDLAAAPLDSFLVAGRQGSPRLLGA
jgi:hypothetical protein